MLPSGEQGDGQGCRNQARTAAATSLATWLDGDATRFLLAYLFGKATAANGFDANGDGRVNLRDLVAVVRAGFDIGKH